MAHRALIIGISGFVGGHLAEHLLACGDAVLGCSPDGAWLDPQRPSAWESIALVDWDIGREAAVPAGARQAIERFRPDCMYHLAALSVPDDCGRSEPSPAARAVNVEGTRRVLELAASLPGRPRVLVVSTAHVYGPVSPQSPRVAETVPLGPTTGYGRSKLLAEEEVRRAVSQRRCDAVIARPCHHTGPRQGPRMMLPQWARQFAAGGSGPIEVYTRESHLDLSDVRDVVRAYRLLVERGECGRAYNVGSGVNRRSGDIVDLMARLAGQPERPIVELKPGFKQEPVADASLLARTTGWRAEIPLETTIADTLAWWRVILGTGTAR